MLGFLRKNTKIIVWSVVIVFVLWGGFAVGTGFQSEGRIAGKVFGKSIYFQEFDTFFRASQIFSHSSTPISDPEILRTKTWQNIILSYEGKNEGIKVSDKEVKSEVLRILKEQKIENPTPEFYKRWLKATLRETPQEFESQIRELLRIQKLVRNVNDAPVTEPTNAEIEDVFSRKNNSLSLKIASFNTREEAEDFDLFVSGPEDWDKKERETPDQFQATGKITLDALINLWGMSQTDVFKLRDSEVDSISDVIAMNGQFSIIRVLEKEALDPEKDVKALKDQYRSEISDRRRYRRFIGWSKYLEERAALEDYLPQTTPPPPPPGEKAVQPATPPEAS